MKNSVRRAAGTPLSDSELRELHQLAAMPDDQIDFSDIPERLRESTGSEFQSVLPLEDHTITLRVDAEVAAWLEDAGKKNPQQTNLVLKRAAQRSRLLGATPQVPLDKAS